MIFWMERNRGGSDTRDSLENMSKAEILRGIITEKLSTAAREILAVVERTVAGYEEEVSAFRREMEQQRRQLEVLQPRVELDKRGLNVEDVLVVSEEEEGEGGPQQSAGEVEENTGSLGLTWFDDDDDDDDDDDKGECGEEEQQPLVPQAKSSRRRREDQKDPDFQVKPRVQSDRKRSRPRLSDTQDHLYLRICILDSPDIDLLTKNVSKRCRVQEVHCPRGLQETDFLDLLWSTFPQLPVRKPFDILASDRTRRLHPLKVKRLTAEEITSSIRQIGGGNSALYIRLKNIRDSEDSPSSSATSQKTLSSRTSLRPPLRTISPRDRSKMRKRGRPRLGEEPTHYFFKVCVLEGSQSDVPAPGVLLKSTIKELQCHRTMREADFVELLRSSFPQLAGDDKALELFKSDRSRRLQRLLVKSLAPVEIYKNNKDKTLLYVRLKTGDEEEELPLVEQAEEAAALLQADSAELSSSSSAQCLEGKTKDVMFVSAPSPTQDEEMDDKDGAEGREDSSDDRKLKARRRRGVSSVEGTWTESSKACKVCGIWYRLQGSLIKHAWRHVDEPQHICGVCGERSKSTDELKGHLRKYQKSHDCSYCGKSFLSITGLSSHMSLHTGDRPYKCDVCDKTFTYMSSLSVHRWVHMSEKPHKCDFCPKAFGLKAQLVAHRKIHTGRDRYVCNVCGKALYDLRSLTRHKSTHSGERRYGCQVCGKRFKLSSTLKSHEKIHTARDRPYLCHVCCKAFMSRGTLRAHEKTHSNEKPFTCGVCSKSFISNGELTAHMRVHTGEAPFGCSECGRFFKRKTHLTNHVRSHMGIKTFMCGVCGKACSRQEHLTVHMRTHNGERPYQCSFCTKTFTQSHCLKTHMKSHQRGSSCS